MLVGLIVLVGLVGFDVLLCCIGLVLLVGFVGLMCVCYVGWLG